MAIPRVPSGFKHASTKQAWKRAWKAQAVKEEDYDSILLLCRLLDERTSLDSWFEDNPRFLIINNNTNVIMHPYVKRIEAIDKQVESLYNSLGLTPMGRSKIGIMPEQEVDDPFAKLVDMWANEDSTPPQEATTHANAD